ncbi:MAG: MOSC domain-containing protein [Gemmatimonadales bacterium]
MSHSAHAALGSVVSLWRYPVKSMMGEELNAAGITERGLLGDRAYALVDSSDGKVASAKNPRKWSQLFDFRAAFVDPPRPGAKVPPVRITLPDGAVVTSEQGNLNQILSRALNREVTLDAPERGHREVVESTFPNPWTPKAEEYWPDMEGLDHRDTVTDFDLPEGTFFDCAVVHLLTTATVDRLRELYPQGRFEVRRFRPNVVVETVNGVKDFVENAWIGRTLAIGEAVRLSITGPCPRCVMTTLPQGDLAKDPGILRTAAQHNHANVGLYASVLRGGTVRRGDAIRLE